MPRLLQVDRKDTVNTFLYSKQVPTVTIVAIVNTGSLYLDRIKLEKTLPALKLQTVLHHADEGQN